MIMWCVLGIIFILPLVYLDYDSGEDIKLSTIIVFILGGMIIGPLALIIDIAVFLRKYDIVIIKGKIKK